MGATFATRFRRSDFVHRRTLETIRVANARVGAIRRRGHGQLIARQAAIKAGIPATFDGYHLLAGFSQRRYCSPAIHRRAIARLLADFSDSLLYQLTLFGPCDSTSWVRRAPTRP